MATQANMKHDVFLLSVVLVLCITFISCSPHIQCQPRPVVISTQAGRTDFRPSHIQVYRCSGGDHDSSPLYYQCMKEESDYIPFTLLDHGSFIRKTFENHTSCTMRCVCDLNGYKCRGGKLYTPTCVAGQIWDHDICQCTTVEDNTGCNVNKGETNGISTTMFIVSLVVEFVAVLIIVFLVMDFFKYRKQSKGVIFKTTQYVRHLSTGEKDGYRVGSIKRDREATGSVSFLHDVNNGNLSNSRVAV